MNIRCLPLGPLSTNTYIVFNEEGREGAPNECAVVDPANSGRVIAELERLNLKCTHILLTHGHFDHIMGAAKLKLHEGAKVLIHEADAGAISGDGDCLAYMAGVPVQHCEVDVRLKDGAVFSAAGFEFKTVHTPGHTEGGVCFVCEAERVIFSGDTLFRLSVGRTDLPGGDSMRLYESILYGLFALSGDYRVLPGHMEETTLDFERRHNPYMKRGGLY